ncbi:MAG TPA: trigger factor [Frankiaceae bacterium]|nr:trigger factor [Frankiaceae bacterium]
MKATKEALTPTRVKLTVEVPFEELKPNLDAAYKSLAQQVRVPGFRPGRVPARVLDQRFGRAHVLDQALNEALPRLYQEAVQSEDLDVIAQPEVDITSFNDGEPLVFTAEVDVRPEIELPEYEGLEVSVDDVALEEDDVTAQLDTLRDRFATLQPVERPVQDGDFLTIDLSASVDGEPVPGADSSGMSYEVGKDSLIAGLDEAVRGASEGEDRTFTTDLVAGDFAGRTADVTVKVRSVKEKERPELDDDFATTASEFDTLAELESDVRERLGRVKKMEQGVQARDKVLETLLDAVDIPLPASVVEGEIEARNNSLVQQLAQIGVDQATYLESEGKTAEEFEAEVRDSAEKAVKAQFVLDTLAEKLDLTVEQEELTEHLIRRAQQAQVSPQDYANQIMQSNSIGVLMAEVLRGKALAHVLDSAKITDASGAEVDLSDLDDHLGHDHEGHDDEGHDHSEHEDVDDADEADGEAYAEETEAIAEVSGGAEVGDAGEVEGHADETVPGAQS